MHASFARRLSVAAASPNWLASHAPWNMPSLTVGRPSLEPASPSSPGPVRTTLLLLRTTPFACALRSSEGHRQLRRWQITRPAASPNRGEHLSTAFGGDLAPGALVSPRGTHLDANMLAAEAVSDRECHVQHAGARSKTSAHVESNRRQKLERSNKVARADKLGLVLLAEAVDRAAPHAACADVAGGELLALPARHCGLVVGDDEGRAGPLETRGVLLLGALLERGQVRVWRALHRGLRGELVVRAVRAFLARRVDPHHALHASVRQGGAHGARRRPTR
eukprot:CAMPEP_0202048840 /NCGR_PEP_ID=MMETSP0963-20130614/2994_1 /ASSEMBLY_ACC=CAM_ASM_000494 /TAXON_ID=4773 /ORGANISM="Schizochytrium aggregatum, Strain ATCC28209" /LENGTH=278 /DNA_ID=CAMNT_0048613801 /DNA_START=92 /DNA_END=924 /DNA_ORIENTATION=+